MGMQPGAMPQPSMIQSILGQGQQTPGLGGKAAMPSATQGKTGYGATGGTAQNQNGQALYAGGTATQGAGNSGAQGYNGQQPQNGALPAHYSGSPAQIGLGSGFVNLPQAQGFNGAQGTIANPNMGGYSPNQSEMTSPGLGAAARTEVVGTKLF